MAETKTTTPPPRDAWLTVLALAAERLDSIDHPTPENRRAVIAVRKWLDDLALGTILEELSQGAAAMAIAPVVPEPPEETAEDVADDDLVFGLAQKVPQNAEGALSVMAIQALGRKASLRHHRTLYALAVESDVVIGTPEWDALASFARRRGLFGEG